MVENGVKRMDTIPRETGEQKETFEKNLHPMSRDTTKDRHSDWETEWAKWADSVKSILEYT